MKDLLPQVNKENIIKITMDIQQIKKDIGEIKCLIQDQNNVFVTKAEFKPVQKIVYGFTGVVLTLVLTALVYSVLK